MADDAWQPGDLVRVLSGPFAELVGTVEEVNAERRKLRVHVAVLGAAYRVELDLDDVEAYHLDDGIDTVARWRRGAAVRILTGPFQYLRGAVLTADDHSQRVVVRLTGLRPEVAVEFDYNEIESA